MGAGCPPIYKDYEKEIAKEAIRALKKYIKALKVGASTTAAAECQYAKTCVAKLGNPCVNNK